MASLADLWIPRSLGDRLPAIACCKTCWCLVCVKWSCVLRTVSWAVKICKWSFVATVRDELIICNGLMSIRWLSLQMGDNAYILGLLCHTRFGHSFIKNSSLSWLKIVPALAEEVSNPRLHPFSLSVTPSRPAEIGEKGSTRLWGNRQVPAQTESLLCAYNVRIWHPLAARGLHEHGATQEQDRLGEITLQRNSQGSPWDGVAVMGYKEVWGCAFAGNKSQSVCSCINHFSRMKQLSFGGKMSVSSLFPTKSSNRVVCLIIFA